MPGESERKSKILLKKPLPSPNQNHYLPVHSPDGVKFFALRL